MRTKLESFITTVLQVSLVVAIWLLTLVVVLWIALPLIAKVLP